MAVETTSTLATLRSRYQNMYNQQAYAQAVYDRISSPVGEDMARFMAGTEIIVPFISKMNIGTSTISETADATPQTLRQATRSFAPTSRGEVLNQSELLRIQNYADNFEDETVKLVAENAIESIDLLAQAQALQGVPVVRAAARASLDAGTAGNRMTDAEFGKAETMLQEFRAPTFPMDSFGNADWVAICPPDAYVDLRTGGNIVSIAQYQQAGLIMGDQELGKIGNFRVMRSPWAKVFGAAGADNGSNAATTLSSAANKLATTIVVASATNITAGRYLTIGTEETADTHYETNERVRVISASGTTITIAGAGSNGGLRHDHASGVAVRNADSVYPVVFGGPESLMKWWSPNHGPFGKLVLGKETGLLDQWVANGFKFYGAYGKKVITGLVVGEYASSLDA